MDVDKAAVGRRVVDRRKGPDNDWVTGLLRTALRASVDAPGALPFGLSRHFPSRDELEECPA
jgi:hypothetical protein